MAYEELASVDEAVDLPPSRVLDEAEALLERLGGHTVLRRTETTLTAKRETPPGRSPSAGLLVLTVAAVPVASGGVRVSVRGNDPEGMRGRRADWASWAGGLPRLSERGAVGSRRPYGVLPRTEVRDNGAGTGTWAIEPRVGSARREAPPLPRPVEEEEVIEGDALRDAPRGAAVRDAADGAVRYEYRVAPLPAAGEALRGAPGADPEGEAAARLLQAVLDEHASEGWEFCGVQSVSVGRVRGRLGAPFGGDRRTARDVAVFRRGLRSDPHG